MHQLPFDKPGRFYRGNIHMHCDASDGQVSLDDAVKMYQQNGYDFIAMTDHFIPQFDWPITDTRSYRTNDFTTLIGAELHAPTLENGEYWHIVAVGLPLDFAPATEGETGPSLAQRAADTGAFIGIAHPAWYGASLNDVLSIECAHAVEVFNQGCAADSDRGESWYITDLALTTGRRLTAFGTDDAHFRTAHPDVFGAWTMVKSEELDPDPLQDALKAGHYYSTQGPLIHDISLNSDYSAVQIRTSPVRSMMAIGPRSRYLAKHGAGLTTHEFPLEKFSDNYFRITVIDDSGKRAWSNPIWLDDLETR
ncbi:MAG: phosphotransferase [Sphaerobacteraceae bacterium]|nr:MAG: phosphotransferase [Sphaerobacteraceae bacterium]